MRSVPPSAASPISVSARISEASRSMKAGAFCTMATRTTSRPPSTGLLDFCIIGSASLLDLPSLQVNATMGDDDRGRLYLRDTGRDQPANSPSGARELGILSTDLLKPSLRFDFWSDCLL